ncbi:MAG: TonB-dependent receptor [Deltaproteobacteria bacterium]|nr:TonB-dependent receptor [Deltaproteobacteria bacterium]
MMMRRMVGVVAALMLMQRVAWAAEEEQAEKSLGTVVVTATRTEQPIEAATNSVSVISAQDIANRQTQTVSDALRDTPGVDVVQPGSTGTAAGVFIRGADTDQTLILVDGVEVNSATLGGFNFGNIMTDDVGRIEVLRGSGGTLYGSEAMAGVINILSAKGAGAPHFSLASGGGNIGTSSSLGAFGGERGIVAFTGSLGYFTTAGFRATNNDFSNLTSALRVDVTPIEHGTLRGFWRSANSSLGLADNNIGNGYGDFIDPNARQSDTFYLGKGEWEHTPTENLTYRISGAYNYTLNVLSDSVDTEVIPPPFPPFFLSYFRVPNTNTVADAQTDYTEGTLGVTTVGFEFKEQTGALKSVSGSGDVVRFDASRNNYAGYVQQQLRFLDDRLSIVGGFRTDGNHDFGSETSAAWSVGYLEDWGQHDRWSTHVKSSYAEGFRAPTFNELFFPKSGNQNLAAETSSEYDVGAAQHLGFEWLTAEATYFTRRTSNLIQFTSVAQCPGAVVEPGATFTPCNLGRADVQGVETVVGAGPIHGVSLRGTYTYLDWNLLGGKQLLRRPHNRMSATLNYDRGQVLRPADRFNANLNVLFVGERTDIDPQTFTNTANQTYTRVDLAMRYDMPLPGRETSTVGVFARVQNLFDRNYDEALGFKSPPINVLAGGRVSF